MINVMFYHKFNLSPNLSSACNGTERYELDLGNGKKCYKDLTQSDYRKLHPVPIIETSLPALQAAGINPQEINVSGLLDPINVGTMQRISEKVLSDFALNYVESNAVSNAASNVNPLDNVN